MSFLDFLLAVERHSRYISWPKLPGLAEWTLTHVSSHGIGWHTPDAQGTQFNILVVFHIVGSEEQQESAEVCKQRREGHLEQRRVSHR